MTADHLAILTILLKRMSDNKELGLKISVESITEHLSCPVCMNRLRQTYITPCGHRYCEPCISEWIGRHQRCPCCNTRLNKEQLIKDAMFDNLIDTVTKEEGNAEEKYFSHLITEAAHTAVGGTDEQNVTDKRLIFSPIEKVLKDHLRQSLVSHEKFYQDLLSEHRKRELKLKSSLDTAIQNLKSCGLTSEEEARKIGMLEEESSQQMISLKEQLTYSTQLVAEAYNRYLTEHIPDFSILPVTVGVSLLNKGLQLNDIVLKPQDSLEDLQQIIKDRMKNNGDEVLEFSDDMKYFCVSPFAKRSLYEMKEMVTDVVEKGLTHSQDVTGLPPGCRPVIQMSVKPGSEILLYGMIKCESDRPKQCFTVTFTANSKSTNTKQAMDYFLCKTCTAKWICRPCMDVCHKDHDVVPYIMNHQPTWACCYCTKTKRCVIQS